MTTLNLSNYDTKKLRDFFRFAEVKATFKTSKNFTYDVQFDEKYRDSVFDFLKIDFRKKDSVYQMKQLAFHVKNFVS